METNQSSCGPTTGASGGPYPATLKRTDQRQPGGTGLRSCTLMVKTMLAAAPVWALEIGSAIETEVRSCSVTPSVSSPTGSVTAVTPGALQEPVFSRRLPSGRVTRLLKTPSPEPFTALIL